MILQKRERDFVFPYTPVAPDVLPSVLAWLCLFNSLASCFPRGVSPSFALFLWPVTLRFSGRSPLETHTCTKCQSTRQTINQTCHFNYRLHLCSSHECIHDHYVHNQALRYKLMLRDKHPAYQKHSAQCSHSLVQLIFSWYECTFSSSIASQRTHQNSPRTKNAARGPLTAGCIQPKTPLHLLPTSFTQHINLLSLWLNDLICVYWEYR